MPLTMSHRHTALKGSYLAPHFRPRRVYLQPTLCRCQTDEEADHALLFDLHKRTDPRYIAKLTRRLDVVWKVSSKKVRKPDQCVCCGGSGQGRCSFCRGTGALTLGHTVFCSLQEGCKSCPVCKSKGSIKCQHCSGTGYRAAWMEEPVCSVDSAEEI